MKSAGHDPQDKIPSAWFRLPCATLDKHLMADIYGFAPSGPGLIWRNALCLFTGQKGLDVARGDKA